MSRKLLQPFEEYQKARGSFNQQISGLASSQDNIECLHKSDALNLLKPLLLDHAPSNQQQAALSIAKLADSSEEIAESVVQNDILTQLVYSLSNSNRHLKKAICLAFKAIGKHSPALAEDLIKNGALPPLGLCLEDFDPAVKEAAASAIGSIAKHNSNLANQMSTIRATDKLILCLKDPEVKLKRASSKALNLIAQHNEELAKPIAETGLDAIIPLLNYNDTQLKRSISQLLGNIAKHSLELSTEVMMKLENPQKLLSCLKDKDNVVKINAAFCVYEIVNKSSENALAICNAGGVVLIVDFIANTKGEPRLNGILSIACISEYGPTFATSVIQAKGVPQLRDALENEPSQVIKGAACLALGKIGSHSPSHSKAVSEANVLSLILYYYMDSKSSDAFKSNARNSLKMIIDSCDNLQALNPLLEIAPEDILKHILRRYIKNLSDSKEELKNFVGELQKLQRIKKRASAKIQMLIEEINSYYPPNIIEYYAGW